MYAPFRMS